MKISIKVKDEFGNTSQVKWEETGVKPLHPGVIFREISMGRAGLSADEISARCEIKLDRLKSYLDGGELLTLGEIEKFKTIWPEAWELVRDVQYDYMFYLENNAWAPDDIDQKDRESLFQKYTAPMPGA